jgi:hypothetical protein
VKKWQSQDANTQGKTAKTLAMAEIKRDFR